MVEGQDEATSVRFSRYAPYTLSGDLVLTFHTRFHYILSPINLLPMFPNDCYPCARPKQRSVMATLGCGRGPRQVPPGPLLICFSHGALRFAARTLRESQIRKLVSRGIN